MFYAEKDIVENCSIVAGIVILIFVGILAFSLHKSFPKEITDHMFQSGEKVITKLDNRVGMIIGIYEHSYKYKVRFGRKTERTGVSLLGPDREITITPYSTIIMKEFELEHYEE